MSITLLKSHIHDKKIMVSLNAEKLYIIICKVEQGNSLYNWFPTANLCLPMNENTVIQKLYKTSSSNICSNVGKGGEGHFFHLQPYTLNYRNIMYSIHTLFNFNN